MSEPATPASDGFTIGQAPCKSCGMPALTLKGVLVPLPPGEQAGPAGPARHLGMQWVPQLSCGSCGRSGQARIEPSASGNQAYDLTVLSWALPADD